MMVHDPHGPSHTDHYLACCPFVDAVCGVPSHTALVGVAQAMRAAPSWTDGSRFERDFDRFTARFADPRGPQTVARGTRPGGGAGTGSGARPGGGAGAGSGAGGRPWASVAGEIHARDSDHARSAPVPSRTCA